jgi:DNA-binding NtrC family response regulator
MESFTEIKQTMFSGQMNEAYRTGDPEVSIMIIDDDVDVSEALTSLLQTHYRLISCRSFEEVGKKLTAEIKLVLLDIKMASKDGMEVFKLLKEERPDLPIVFHSAYPGSSEKAAALERLSHHGYLTKGEYNLPELLATIEDAMNQPADMSLVSPEFRPNKTNVKEN